MTRITDVTIEGEELDQWARDMLSVINKSGAGREPVDGGISGLGSTDGLYIYVTTAAGIVLDLEDAGYAYSPTTLYRDAPKIVHDAGTECGYLRGLLIEIDDEFPSERRLSWFDESKF